MLSGNRLNDRLGSNHQELDDRIDRSVSQFPIVRRPAIRLPTQSRFSRGFAFDRPELRDPFHIRLKTGKHHVPEGAAAISRFEDWAGSRLTRIRTQFHDLQAIACLRLTRSASASDPSDGSTNRLGGPSRSSRRKDRIQPGCVLPFPALWRSIHANGTLKE